MKYVPLHLHTEYSLLDGAIKVKDLFNFAKENNMPKCGNVILLGAAAACFKILDKKTLYDSIERIFGSKGEAVVEMNHRAFNIGYEAAAS